MTSHWGDQLRNKPGIRFLGEGLPMPELTSATATGLPVRRLRRQFKVGQSGDHEAASDLLYARAVIEASTRLEEEGRSSEEAERLMPSRLQALGEQLKAPLTVGLPGTAPRYLSTVREAQKSTVRAASPRRAGQPRIDALQAESQAKMESRALSIILAHRAAGDESMSFVAGDVPRDAFYALADLERHWADAAKPWKVQKLLDRLNVAAAPIWTDEFKYVISKSSRIQAVTNFPLGLLRFPADSAPLACRTPIAYSPLTPLTRALQSELGFEREVDFTRGFKVLVAECIPSEDPVGKMSRAAWDVGAGIFGDPSHETSLSRVETLSVRALRDQSARTSRTSW